MPSALILYNPYSGRFPPLPAALLAEQVLRRLGWQVQLAATLSAADLTGRARQAAAEGLEVVFIAGGDGSLHLAIQGLAGSQTILAPLPVGTANVWAQELGLVKDGAVSLERLEPLLQRLLHGRVYAMDLGRCNQEYFLTWSGIGLDALTIRQIEPRPRWAKKLATPHYAANILWQVPGWRGMELSVQLNGQTFSQRCILALASNTSLYLGGKNQLAADVYLDDGLQDLWVFSGSWPHQSLEYALRLFWNTHHGMPGLQRHAFREVTLTAQPLWLQMDGDPVEQAGPLHFAVQPGALRILAPLDLPRPMFKQAGLPLEW